MEAVTALRSQTMTARMASDARYSPCSCCRQHKYCVLPNLSPSAPAALQVPVGTCLLMYGDLAGRSDMRLSANPSYDTGIWVEKQRKW